MRFLLSLAAALIMSPAFGQTDQNDPASVVGVVAQFGEAPLPIVGDGAVNYSPEQTASFLCEFEDVPLSFLLSAIPQAAHDATLKAREVRMRALSGLATQEELEKTELERQKAVRRLNGQPRSQKPREERTDIRLEDVTYKRVLENGRAVLLVSGKVRNTTDEVIDLPPVSMETIDVRGFVLAGQTTQLDQVSVGPGQTQDFALRFRNPPQYTKSVTAYFAGPFLVRNFRGCEFFDPLTFDATKEQVKKARATVTPLPVPKVGQGAPAYTAAELAAMARHVRQNASTAFSRRKEVDACTPPAPWRPLMIEADRLEEAWIATNAAEEARRDGARGVFLAGEVAEAELARQSAVLAFRAVAPSPRQPKLADYPALSLGAPVIGGDRETRVEVTIANAAKGRTETPPLLVTVVDRFGFVVSQTVQRTGERVRGEAARKVDFDLALPRSLVGQVQAAFAC